MPNAIISSLISSLLPILVTVLFAWLGNRNERSRRKQMFDDAKQRMELINTYVTSQKLVVDDPNELGNVKKTAANELYAIKAFLDNRLHSLEKASEKSENYFQRFFLLYHMRSRSAGFFRAFFFLMLFASALWSAFLASTSFRLASEQEWYLVTPIIVIIIFTLPGVLVTLLLRWLAIKFDKPAD